jgi:hypothetical protein
LATATDLFKTSNQILEDSYVGRARQAAGTVIPHFTSYMHDKSSMGDSSIVGHRREHSEVYKREDSLMSSITGSEQGPSLFSVNSGKMKLTNTLNYGYSYRYLEKQKNRLLSSTNRSLRFSPNVSLFTNNMPHLGSNMESPQKPLSGSGRGFAFGDRANSV